MGNERREGKTNEAFWQAVLVIGMSFEMKPLQAVIVTHSSACIGQPRGVAAATGGGGVSK